MATNPRNYVDNKRLYQELKDWLIQCDTNQYTQMPDYVATAIMQIAHNLSKRYNFSGYTSTWRDEMVGDAIEHCLKYIKNFNYDKYDNPHSYITMICFNAFVQRIKFEKKQTACKYRIFIENAMDYEDEEGEHRVDQEFYQQMLERVDEYESKKKPDKEKPLQDHPMEAFYGKPELDIY